MDIENLCVEIERATKSLTPVSVAPVKAEGRIATIRLIAEGFALLNLPQRIRATLSCINAYDPMILRQYDVTFELLTPVEDSEWNSSESNPSNERGRNNKMAAKDAEL